MSKEIIINPKKLSGKQAMKLVDDAIKSRSKQYGGTFTKRDFIEISTLSRAQLNRYRLGEKPGIEGAYKLAKGLKEWGYTVSMMIE